MNKSLSLLFFGTFICLYGYCTPSAFDTNSLNSPVEQIRSNLYVKLGNAAPTLLDGDLTQYDPSYSNLVDGRDARKMSNFSENMGMIRGATVLVIERRQTIISTDTIFYKMWQMQQRTYQLEFITSNLDHPGMQGFLQDNYLKTSTPIDLNGITKADFSIDNNPASADVYRFRIIFKSISAGPLPLLFTSIKGTRQNNDIRIEWKTENESNMKDYTIERSDDGNHFSVVKAIGANNLSANTYSWLDVLPGDRNNYYRIIIAEMDGKTTRSPVVKISGDEETVRINIFPNPVVNNTIHLELADQVAGNYTIRVLNNSGQVIYQGKINHYGGNLIQTIRPNKPMIKGVYQVEVFTPANTTFIKKIVY